MIRGGRRSVREGRGGRTGGHQWREPEQPAERRAVTIDVKPLQMASCQVYTDK